MINKKLFSLISTVIVSTLLLAGCVNKPDEPTVATPKETSFTGVKSVELPYDKTGKSKDVIVTDVTFKDGKPTDVNIDVKTEDGTIKSKLSADGGYIMKEGETNAWHEQIDLLEKGIKDNNFDLSKIPLIDDDGHIDAVTSVSIKVSTYLESVQNALDEVNK